MSAQSGFTPEPWILDIYEAHPEDAIGGEVRGPKGKHIADIPNYRSAGITKSTMLANGYLISSAPRIAKEREELLAALVECIAIITEVDPSAAHDIPDAIEECTADMPDEPLCGLRCCEYVGCIFAKVKCAREAIARCEKGAE